MNISKTLTLKSTKRTCRISKNSLVIDQGYVILFELTIFSFTNVNLRTIYRTQIIACLCHFCRRLNLWVLSKLPKYNHSNKNLTRLNICQLYDKNFPFYQNNFFIFIIKFKKLYIKTILRSFKIVRSNCRFFLYFVKFLMIVTSRYLQMWILFQILNIVVSVVVLGLLILFNINCT